MSQNVADASADELLRWIADVYAENKMRGFSETKCRARTLSRNLLLSVHKYLGRQLPCTAPNKVEQPSLWKE